MRNHSKCSINDTRRVALVCVASLGTLVLSACSGKSDPDPKPSAPATLLKLDEVKDALQVLSGAVDDLQTAVGGFDSEDWKDVVPQVRTSAVDVADSLDKLKQLMAGNAAD